MSERLFQEPKFVLDVLLVRMLTDTILSPVKTSDSSSDVEMHPGPQCHRQHDMSEQGEDKGN